MVRRSWSLKDSICFHDYTSILVRYVYSKGLTPENKMWYFSVKQSIQFIESGEYGLALSRIFHSSYIVFAFLVSYNIRQFRYVSFVLVFKRIFMFI